MTQAPLAPAPPCPASFDGGLVLPEPLTGAGYRIVAKVGEGGTAEVYEVEHLGLGKRFVAKLLRQDRVSDPQSLERMRFEAQALARLAHENITAVTDCGLTADGRSFFVMERLAGRTALAELRARRCLPVTEAVELVQQLCAGLSAAHALGIVHRDIKLENLFLCDREDGRRVLKILDFGIAKLLPGADPERAPAPPVKSQEGFPLGTPRFLSPEQALCRPVDERTDVYGAALALYELIAGRDPFFDVNDIASLLEAHVSQTPRPPSAIAPQPIEPAVDDVILRALSKRPSDRYATTAELSAALGRAVIMRPRSEAAPEPARHRARVRIVALTALLMVGAASVAAAATAAVQGLR
jgi:serine/threonine protein kinase